MSEKNKECKDNVWEPDESGNSTENYFLKGEHEYTYISEPICSLADGMCDMKTVMDIINKVGVHPKQKTELIPGKEHIGDVDILGPWGIDNVTSTAIYNGEQQVGVRNITMEGHILHNGRVDRTLFEKDGNLHIKTYGVSDCGGGLFGGLNVALREVVWGPVDTKVIEKLGELTKLDNGNEANIGNKDLESTAYNEDGNITEFDILSTAQAIANQIYQASNQDANDNAREMD